MKDKRTKAELLEVIVRQGEDLESKDLARVRAERETRCQKETTGLAIANLNTKNEQLDHLRQALTTAAALRHPAVNLDEDGEVWANGRMMPIPEVTAEPEELRLVRHLYKLCQ